MKRGQKQIGFTIVELLIVIVVIGILAAITVVAFGNIQQRTNNTQTVAAMKEAVKLFAIYGTQNGDYPNVSGCIGEGYANHRCLSQSGTAECFGMGGSGDNPSYINNALRTVSSGTLPSFSKQLATCGATAYTGAYASYNSTNGTMGTWMILRGDQACPTMSPNVSSVSKVYSGDATLCRYILSAINP